MFCILYSDYLTMRLADISYFEVRTNFIELVWLDLFLLFPLSAADFDMSVTKPKDVSVGQDITLTCQVNIPLTDVTLRWTVAGKKLNKRLLGHLHPHRGVSEVTVSNIGRDDYGIYSCIATYTLGDRVVIDMKAAIL